MTTADEVVRVAAVRVGLDPGEAVLLRDGSNTLFRLPGSVVARVGPAGTAQRARREIDVARWLGQAGIGVVRPVGGFDQPVVVDGRPVTWWDELPTSRPATPAELGTVLRTLHRIPSPTDFDLPALDPFAGFVPRIAAAEAVTDADRRWLGAHLRRLRRAWVELPTGLPRGVIHGDAWQSNVAVTETGETFLLDLEHVATGPPEWDLVHLAADYVDFARIDEPEYRSFVEGYGGYDVTTWPGFRTMADVVELRWVCFALGRAAHDQAAADEVQHRIACLRGDIQRPWTWRAL